MDLYDDEYDNKTKTNTNTNNYSKIPELISQENIKLGEKIGYQERRTFIADYDTENSYKKVVAKEIDDLAQYNILLNIKDENIIDHIGIVEPNSKNNLPLLLMDYVEGQTLKEKLEESNEIKLEIILDWALQIAKGVSVLHDNDIVHRDLSSNNIMITNDSKLKLIDIGDQNVIGTPLNMAPEAYDCKITKMSDIFSYGSILWEIVTCLKEEPFEDIKSNELNKYFIAYKIGIEKKNLKIPDYCEQNLAQLIRDCWKYEPTERPTIKQICQRLENEINNLSIEIESSSNNPYLADNNIHLQAQIPSLLFNC